MLSTLFSATISGIQALPVRVEVDVASRGLPGIKIVGLPTQAVQESKERVRTALHNAGYTFRAKKVIINLAPANIPKHGPAFDLPIALGLLHAYGCIPPLPSRPTVYYGELGLDGSVKPTRGAFAVGLIAQSKGWDIAVCANQSGLLTTIPSLNVIPITSLRTLTTLLPSPTYSKTLPPPPLPRSFPPWTYFGQEAVLRGLVLAASGRHHMICIGPPGTGKTMLQEAYKALLPALNTHEMLESSAILSAFGTSLPGRLVYYPPFVQSYHAQSARELFGGGMTHPVGLATLSHHGVLMCDELPKYSKQHLALLQTILDSHVISTTHTDPLPAHFTLFATMNLCACGHGIRCTCTLRAKQHYVRAIPESLFDRIDLFTSTQTFVAHESENRPIDLAPLALQIEQATQIQRERYANTSLSANGDLESKDLETYCPLTLKGKTLLHHYADAFHLSARRYVIFHRIARTIADIDNQEIIDEHHVAESAQYCVREN